MTKKELKKEAEKFLGGWLIDPEIVKLLVDFAEPREKRIAELEKDKAYTEGQLDEQIQATLKLQKENAELKADNDARKFAMVMSEKVEKQLQDENAELKKRVENQKSFLERIRAKFELGEIDRKEIEGYLESEQLTNAKDLLKNWLKLYNTNTVKGIITDTEQFLNSEVEK